MPRLREARIHKRLSDGVARIHELEMQREWFGDFDLGRAEEERIIFSGLVDLELQAIDEEIEEICRRVGRPWRS